MEQGPVKPQPGERVTMFREPRLPSGFPDLVAVVWKESVASEWSRARRDLTVIDLRLMHYLAASGPKQLEDLNVLFRSETERCLERLLLSDMVRFRRGRWRARPLSRIFAARRIVAVEAKVSEWRGALDQAFLNTWFTPESYILIPAVPRRTMLLDIAHQRGIGVLCKDRTNLTPQWSREPRSYVSWLLNEWAWRAASL